MKLRVASRESRLAVIQSQQVMETLARLHPELELELVTMKTIGDRILDRTLDGGCSAPTAAYAQVEGDTLTIRGFYADADGRIYRASAAGPRQDGAALAADLAHKLKEDAHVR
ncbi:hypothetical protein [Dysosmobacter sp.]|jgi:porphobilinogen deaminase|uniref:hypothetical protein n=1 Tax=Dysosmobacter sp. TaxID=2591382 RepID=UPI003D91FF73